MSSMRARRVITRGPTHVVGIFPSLKNNASIHWESQLERDRICQLEFDPDVIAYREQPETYAIPFAGRRGYTPDFEVRRRNGIYVEEVKPSHKLHKYTDIFEIMPDILAEEGKHFRVVTEETIRIEPALSNIKYLLLFCHFKLDEEVVHQIRKDLRPLGAVPFYQFQKIVAERTNHAWAPWSFLAHHHARVELNKSFDDHSLVWVANGEKSCLS